MSLIGPRPERPEFDEILDEKIPFYNTRYLIKPGLSGWAQVNYPYGANLEDNINELKYDLYYKIVFPDNGSLKLSSRQHIQCSSAEAYRYLTQLII